MARLLLQLIKFTARTAVQIVFSVASTCLSIGTDANNTLINGFADEGESTPRKRATPINEYRRRSRELKAERSMTMATKQLEEEQDQREYVDVRRLLDAPMKEVFVLDDFPVLIEIPNVIIDDAPEAQPARVIPIMRTPRRQPIVDPGFSIYSDPSAPHLNKAMYITPVRQALMASGGDTDLTLLRAASERVSEILQENRRRVDAGEDPSTVRREARRKRAQEISAARQHIAGGLSCFEL